MSKFDDLLAKEVTRKQFLLSLGAGFLGLFGLASLLGILSDNLPQDEGRPDYGLRTYGP